MKRREHFPLCRKKILGVSKSFHMWKIVSAELLSTTDNYIWPTNYSSLSVVLWPPLVIQLPCPHYFFSDPWMRDPWRFGVKHDLILENPPVHFPPNFQIDNEWRLIWLHLSSLSRSLYPHIVEESYHQLPNGMSFPYMWAIYSFYCSIMTISVPDAF